MSHPEAGKQLQEIIEQQKKSPSLAEQQESRFRDVGLEALKDDKLAETAEQKINSILQRLTPEERKILLNQSIQESKTPELSETQKELYRLLEEQETEGKSESLKGKQVTDKIAPESTSDKDTKETEASFKVTEAVTEEFDRQYRAAEEKLNRSNILNRFKNWAGTEKGSSTLKYIGAAGLGAIAIPIVPATWGAALGAYGYNRFKNKKNPAEEARQEQIKQQTIDELSIGLSKEELKTPQGRKILADRIANQIDKSNMETPRKMSAPKQSFFGKIKQSYQEHPDRWKYGAAAGVGMYVLGIGILPAAIGAGSLKLYRHLRAKNQLIDN